MQTYSETARLFEVARRVAASLAIDLQEGSPAALRWKFHFQPRHTDPRWSGPVADGAHALHEWVDVKCAAKAALLAGLINALTSIDAVSRMKCYLRVG